MTTDRTYLDVLVEEYYKESTTPSVRSKLMEDRVQAAIRDGHFTRTAFQERLEEFRASIAEPIRNQRVAR